MKSYLPAATLGIVLTAGAFAFGAATAHATVDHVNRGYSVQINGSAAGAPICSPVTAVDGLTAVVGAPPRRN